MHTAWNRIIEKIAAPKKPGEPPTEALSQISLPLDVREEIVAEINSTISVLASGNPPQELVERAIGEIIRYEGLAETTLSEISQGEGKEAKIARMALAALYSQQVEDSPSLISGYSGD